MRARKFLLYGVAIAGLLAGATAADAQSNPGLYTSQVPKASQWNGYYSIKQAYNAALTQNVTNCGTAGVPCLTALGNLGGTPGSTTYLNGAGSTGRRRRRRPWAQIRPLRSARPPSMGSATTFMRSDAAPPLPSTLPALSGVNLTNLNASALASGTVPAGLLPLATTSAFGAVKPRRHHGDHFGGRDFGGRRRKPGQPDRQRSAPPPSMVRPPAICAATRRRRSRPPCRR